MALDYSKLSDDELDAIANDDYSRLSDKTLRAITRDPGAKSAPEPSMDFTTQAVRAGVEVAPQVGSAAAQTAKFGGGLVSSQVKDYATIGKILYQNASLDNVGQFLKEPVANTGKAIGAYVAGHPTLSNITGSTPQQAVAALGRGAGNVANFGRTLAAGAVMPESAFLLPYQMAAYEQEKIQQDPNAPGLERNPYAMAYRGEAPTQGAAGAMNQRRAVMSMPITGVNAEEKRMLEEDQKRRLEMLTRYEAAKRIIGPR
jgi:hypothetical protein